MCVDFSFSLLQCLDRDRVKRAAGNLEGNAQFEEFASLTGAMEKFGNSAEEVEQSQAWWHTLVISALGREKKVKTGGSLGLAGHQSNLFGGL